MISIWMYKRTVRITFKNSFGKKRCSLYRSPIHLATFIDISSYDFANSFYGQDVCPKIL